MASPKVNCSPEPSRADRSPVFTSLNADVDNMADVESVPSPARSPSARHLQKLKEQKRVSITNSTTRSGSVDTPLSRADAQGLSRMHTHESMASTEHFTHEQLRERYDAAKLRAARAEAKNEACLRRISQLTQTVQFMQGDKDMGMQAQAEHIQNLQWQVNTLAEENAMHKSKGAGKGAAHIQQMEVVLHQKIQEVEQSRRELFTEMETVRREKHDLTTRRKELEVQCEVLNAKLKGGSARVEQAMNMQQDLKSNLDAQVKLNLSLQKDLDEAQNKNKQLEEGLPAENDHTRDEKEKLKKDLKRTQKELQNEKDFIKALKEKFKAKSDECKALEKKTKELETAAKKAGKGKGKGDQAKQVDTENLVKELYAQLSSANGGKSALAEKVHRAEHHIKMLEDNEKLQIQQVEEIVARHNDEIFEWKRKLERAQDAKVEALNDMRRKMADAQQVGDQMQTNSMSKNWSLTGKQMTLFTHCLIVGVITMFVMDWMNLLA